MRVYLLERERGSLSTTHFLHRHSLAMNALNDDARKRAGGIRAQHHGVVEPDDTLKRSARHHSADTLSGIKPNKYV